MVNLQQIILSFESNKIIGPDEEVSAQYNQTFCQIQEELNNRIAKKGMQRPRIEHSLKIVTYSIKSMRNT
ncbi:MAG: hypothetical protein WC046_07555 [Candidatus Bathyarchaeia archaeon]|jgi:hypothetical protein